MAKVKTTKAKKASKSPGQTQGKPIRQAQGKETLQEKTKRETREARQKIIDEMNSASTE